MEINDYTNQYIKYPLHILFIIASTTYVQDHPVAERCHFAIFPDFYRVTLFHFFLLFALVPCGIQLANLFQHHT